MDDGPYYLDDLRVGQRFTTGEYELDADDAVAFASQWDPSSPSTRTQRPRPAPSSASWWRPAGTPRPSPCACSSRLPGRRRADRGRREISWPAPTRPDAVLHVEGRSSRSGPRARGPSGDGRRAPGDEGPRRHRRAGLHGHHGDARRPPADDAGGPARPSVGGVHEVLEALAERPQRPGGVVGVEVDPQHPRPAGALAGPRPVRRRAPAGSRRVAPPPRPPPRRCSPSGRRR